MVTILARRSPGKRKGLREGSISGSQKLTLKNFKSSKNASKTLHSGTDNEREAGNHGNKKASLSNAFHCSLARSLVFFF